MTSSIRSFLGVDRSISGRRWTSALDQRMEAAALAMAQKLGLPDIVARVLAARGIGEADAGSFLEPRLRDLMPDPSSLTDMDAAAARIADAIDRREQVAIFGDYDVDGAASSALLWRYLSHFGIKATIRIPDRITEGYGPNPPAMRALVEEGATLIVTVDCGTGSFEAIAEARSAGADVVVLDHHQTGPALPEASAVVNPNRQDDLSGLGHLCAAGVVFMTLVATSRVLRARGRASAAMPDILGLIDLVALATVCDVVPLKALNRAFVVQGLKIMREQRNHGLAALARVARLAGPVESHHLGFLIGPRINAGGRIGDAWLGSHLLCLDDAEAAQELAERLHGLNEERQAMEQVMLATAEAEVVAEIGAGPGPAVLVTGSDDWHPGIVGLIAARLKERHRRPAFAIAFDGSDRGTGSGRSIPGIDLGRLVRQAVSEGILEKGGGHAMAAGVTIRRTHLGAFRQFLETESRAGIDALRSAESLRLDGAVSGSGLTLSLYETLSKAGPFGAGHETPLLALPRQRVADAGVVGKGHVRATLKGAEGRTVRAIAFKAADGEMGQRLLRGRDDVLHVAGTVSLDRFRGQESIGFRIVDVAEAFD
ncbi:single-stranded-DNA-specific exonuclease RecJ [Aurantimonas sp. VKM B-3413]|uniref:single-stranded-DNA-specific exonuclease RecJ n=1 Tax=Aurantimonas sp. VKM B-3413 TaxID=2779401 RepID=UPI001E5FF647|nr:single-stranded-DNA-specific exonuclease RecJ [Aurantimonas sp. VKM B-3413]MCB8837858.1 single-stranded-DNA-specific exonuclease RecJ [Aurantimonas sp. VKM B-3413]